MAGARAWCRAGEWLFHPEHCGSRYATTAATGTSRVVPILFPYRARPCGLAANRHEFCKLLWRLWSPNWTFDDATYERTAASFDNPDFVDVVIHSYRHRFGYAAGTPDLEAIEQRLAKLPPIAAPAIVLSGGGDGVASPSPPQARRASSLARFSIGPFR
jgi:hypothetical protein